MYEKSINSTDRKKRYFRRIVPHENLNFKCRSKRGSILSIGISAGYKCIDSQISPLSSAIREVCKPQPGHATPKCSWKVQAAR